MRLRHSHFKAAGLVIALYIVLGSLYLGLTSLPDTREGLTYLQLGQERLITDPSAASQQFTKASASLEETSSGLKVAPFVLKLITPLPPFRWYVAFLKGVHALSIAGRQASALSASFPTLLPTETTDLNGVLRTSTSRYSIWATGTSQNVAVLLSSLQTAQEELDSVPSWIAIGHKRDLEALRSQIRDTRSALSTINSLSFEAIAALGAGNTVNHTWLLTVHDGGGQTVNAYLTARSGSVTSLQFLPGRQAEVEPGPFFALSAPIRASRQKVPTEGIISLDASVLTRLLTVSGPLTLPENGLTVSADTPQKVLVSVPVLSELFPALINSLSRPPAAGHVVDVLAHEVAGKEIQLWSARKPLQDLLAHALAQDIPSENNWVKISGNAAALHMDINQGLPVGGSLRQVIALTGSGSATLYLPFQATGIQGAQTIQTDTGVRYATVTAALPARIEYTLPNTKENLYAVRVLKTEGREHDTVSAFGRQATVTENIFLTRQADF